MSLRCHFTFAEIQDLDLTFRLSSNAKRKQRNRFKNFFLLIDSKIAYYPITKGVSHFNYVSIPKILIETIQERMPLLLIYQPNI